MTINATAMQRTIACMADGNASARYPDGNTGAPPSAIVARIRARGWGQEVLSTDAVTTITLPAPGYVFFDALDTIGEAGVDTWREYGYHWDYGYSPHSLAGTWAHTGGSKGQEVGRRPLSAHVYEAPGAYTASVRVQNSTGTYSDASVTIIVVDADTYWTTGGRSTVVVSAAGPAPTWADDRRYQFARGSNYTGLTLPAINGISRIALAAAGSGAEPVMPALTIEQANITTRSPWANCVVLSDLDLRAGLAVNKPCRSVLQYRGLGRHTQWGVGVAWYWGSAQSSTRSAGWHYPMDICQYECDLDGADAAGAYSLSGSCSRWAIIGCALSESTYHNLRQFGFYKSFVAHNSLTASGSTYANMTNRSLGMDTSYDKWDEYDGTALASRYLVAAYNTLGGASDTFAGSCHTIQPQDGNHAEGIEDVILDANGSGRASGGGLVVIARRVTEASNEYASRSLDTSRGADVTPAEWFGPYYSDTVTPDASLIFEAPTLISPDKAGT